MSFVPSGFSGMNTAIGPAGVSVLVSPSPDFVSPGDPGGPPVGGVPGVPGVPGPPGVGGPPGAPPLPGQSLVPAFARDGAVTRDGLFFHHEGNRALRVGDYKLVSAREDGDAWELYNLGSDRCEQHDLAARQPDRVRGMAAQWQRMQDGFVRDAGSTGEPGPGAKSAVPSGPKSP